MNGSRAVEYSSKIDIKARELISKMILSNPSKRPNIAQILYSNYVQGMKTKHLINLKDKFGIDMEKISRRSIFGNYKANLLLVGILDLRRIVLLWVS